MNKKILFLLLCFIMVFGVACSAEGDYYDGFIVKDDVKETGDKIPSGGQYIKKATKSVYEAGQNMPEKAAMGDVYKYGDYVYTMRKDGWAVVLGESVEKTKESYGEIMAEIAGYPILDLNDLFKGCTNMKTAPELPDTVTEMNYTFYECAALEEVSKLPSGLVSLQYIFSGCTSLKEAPEIPTGITNMKYAFSGCTSLTKAPKLPENLKIVSYAFEGCTGITESPDIPVTVTDMAGIFKDCTGLLKGPTVPENVDYLTDAFRNCTSLTGTLVINANPSNNASCFMSVNFAAQGLEVTGTSKMIERLMKTGIVE